MLSASSPLGGKSSGRQVTWSWCSPSRLSRSDTSLQDLLNCWAVRWAFTAVTSRATVLAINFTAWQHQEVFGSLPELKTHPTAGVVSQHQQARERSPLLAFLINSSMLKTMPRNSRTLFAESSPQKLKIFGTHICHGPPPSQFVTSNSKGTGFQECHLAWGAYS